MQRTPKPWIVSKSGDLFGRYTIDDLAHEQVQNIVNAYGISDEEGERIAYKSEELNEGNRLLIQEAPILLELVEEAFGRFTDNDMQPTNHRLSTWLKKASETLCRINSD
jgi:hypothetical protein